MKNAFNYLVANLLGEYGKKRQIISCSLLGGGVFLLLYLIIKYAELILGLFLILSLIMLDRSSLNNNATPFSCCPLYNLIRSCLFEAVSVSTDATSLKCPVSEASLDTIQHPLGSDGIQRFEYYVRLTVQSPVLDQTSFAFVKEILTAELNRSFQQNLYLFENLCSEITGLYIEKLSPATGGLTITIIPVCKKTHHYVDLHNKRQLIQNINHSTTRRPLDDLF